MTQRQPDYSIRDHLVVAAQNKFGEFADIDRAKRIGDWLHVDLHLPESTAVTVGVVAEIGGRAISASVEAAHKIGYLLTVGLEGASDAYDDIRSLPVHPVRSLKKHLSRAEVAHAHIEDGEDDEFISGSVSGYYPRYDLGAIDGEMEVPTELLDAHRDEVRGTDSSITEEDARVAHATKLAEAGLPAGPLFDAHPGYGDFRPTRGPSTHDGGPGLA